MVYSRFLELPQLGSSHGLLQRTAQLSGPLDPVTASLEAKWLGVSELVLNATAEAKRAGVTTPHPYAENSICFVEPMTVDCPVSIDVLHHSGPSARQTSPPDHPSPKTLHRPSTQAPSHGAEAVMFIFIFGVVLGAVPQYLKLILLASSEGISLVSLALMNVSNLTATLNIFILHFEQIKMCIKQSVPEYSFDACQASLLTFYYTLVYTLLWFPLYPLAAHFCSNRKSEACGVVQSQRQHAWQGLVAHLIPCVILAAPVLKMALSSSACYEYEAYALLLGVVNAVLEAIRYLPQVYASWYSMGSGSLSYLRLLLSIFGGVGATVQKAMMHEDVSTWFPPLVGHSLEIVIVLMNLYHDMRNSGAGVGKNGDTAVRGEDVESGEAVPLTAATRAAETEVMNRALERGERREGGGAERGEEDGDEGARGDGEKRNRSRIDDDDDDGDESWLDELEDKGVVDGCGYCCEQMCTNPKFLRGLIKYM